MLPYAGLLGPWGLLQWVVVGSALSLVVDSAGVVYSRESRGSRAVARVLLESGSRTSWASQWALVVRDAVCSGLRVLVRVAGDCSGSWVSVRVALALTLARLLIARVLAEVARENGILCMLVDRVRVTRGLVVWVLGDAKVFGFPP